MAVPRTGLRVVEPAGVVRPASAPRLSRTVPAAPQRGEYTDAVKAEWKA